jgi:hypothetical protein
MGKRIAALRRDRLLMLVLSVAVTVVALAVAAGPAFAWGGWAHGNTTITANCLSGCHMGVNGVTDPGTNAECQTCHGGTAASSTNFVLHSGFNCWSCHKPGQSMTALQTNAGCTGVCHTQTGHSEGYTTDVTPHGTNPHLGSTAVGCTTCHGVTPAWDSRGASPHHNAENTTPAPTTCTDCHGNSNVSAAPAAPHGTLVTGVTACSTCHVGFTPTHPTAAKVVAPTLNLTATQPVGNPDVTIKGTLKNGTTALAGVTVYLQSTPDSISFVDLPGTPVTTAADGSFTFTVVAATPGTSYRAISQGVASGQTVIKPALKTATVTVPVAKATITLKLSGLTAGKIKLRKTVTAKGVVRPSSVGEKVTVLIQKKNAKGVYVKLTTKTGLVKTGSAYSIPYKTAKKGAYRMQASIAANAVHSKATSPWRTFTVK